ncbi:MAG: PQQ-binding-like beta-propeller repeat protein [Chloroflexota bacterium]
MNENLSLERMISAVMADEAAGFVPDRMLDDVLSSTARLRPAPRWLALLKEPPMRVDLRSAVGFPARSLIIALGVVLMIVAAAAVAVGASLLFRAPSSAGGDWPMFRGDATRSGVALQGPAGRPALRWRYQATSSVSGNISIVGDMVFVGSDDGILHALGLSDGVERWTYKKSATNQPGPSVANGLVYLSDAGGAFVALDPATGQERWRSATSYNTPSSATADSSVVSFGTSDGLLIALDAKTGTERWSTPISTTGGSVHAPAIAGGLVYASSDKGGFVAVDAVTGTLAWRLDTGTDQTGTAVVADGVAYIGASADATPGGHLRTVDARTGAPLWQVDGMHFSPTVVGGVAYTTDTSGTVTARDTANGTERWRFQVQGTARAPAIAAGVVYVSADSEHRVYALEASTGRELWHFDVDGASACCIAVAHGSVFVGTAAGGVYDIGGDGTAVVPLPLQSFSPTAVPAATVAPSPSGSPSATGTFVTSPVTFVWKATDPGATIIPTALTFDPAGRIWAADGPSDRFAIFNKDGKFVEFWGASGTGDGQLKLTRSNGNPYGAVAFEPDGSFFVLDVGNRRVQHFDAKRTFVRAWGSFGSGPGQFSDPVGIAIGSDGNVHVLDDARGVIETYDQNGKVLGSIPAFSAPGAGANTLAIDSNGDFYVSQIDPTQVTRIDPTGKVTMTYGAPGSGTGEFHEQPTGMSVDAEGRLYVTQGPNRGDHPGVQVFRPDGTYLAGWGPIGTGNSDLTFPWGVLLDGNGHAVVADASALEDPGTISGLKQFQLLPPLAP